MQYRLLRSTHFSYRICVICQFDIKHFMFQLHLFSMRRLDYFSLAVLNNYPVCLLCSVSSVPSIFLVIISVNSSKIRCVTVQMYILQKRSQKSCRLNFYSIEDKKTPLRDSISSHFFHSFFFLYQNRFYGVAAVVRPRTQ